ncbi:MAG TPA: EAL domain-containing protein, partial [Burkholderiaceae bacterium]|nr:EAL domain-containing protein [Burkholderiaceae bacterium]
MMQLIDVAAALEVSSCPFLLLDADMRIAAVNQAYLKSSALQREDMIGHTISEVFSGPGPYKHESRPPMTPETSAPSFGMRAADRDGQLQLVRIQDLFNHSPGFMHITRGPDHIFEIVNQPCYQFFGHRAIIGQSARTIMADMGRGDLVALLDNVYQTGKPHAGRSCTVKLHRSPGAPTEDACVDFVYQPIFGVDDAVTGILTIGYETTQQLLAQDNLRASEERLQLALEAVGDGVWDWNIQKDTFSFSTRGKAMLGYQGDEVGGQLEKWLAITHPDDQERVRAETVACVRGLTPFFTSEYRVRTKDGNWKWLLARGAVVSRDNNGRSTRMVGTTVDISSEQETLWRANFDALTGLPNRSLFRDRLGHEIVNSRRTGKPLALFFIDLDHFKEVNDLLGHNAGDMLLRQAADRIRACVREPDTVARLGGDEFTVILSNLDSMAHVETIAEKILLALAEPFVLAQKTAHVSGSIGITLHPRDASEPEDLVRNADQAMYVAKNAGRNQFSFFTRSMQEAAWQRLKLIGELRNALAERQLAIHLQPIVDLDNGRIVKAEALLRWQHPQKGLLMPAEFIGLAEETGLINPIGNWVFMQAAACSKYWSDRLGSLFQISVNRSPIQFLPNEKAMNWGAHLQELGLAWNSISVEITENLLLNATPGTTSELLALRDAGIQVAIDDFGTGYSSMAYLKKFDIDYLKIDQSFVKDAAVNSVSRTIAETIIVMAHKLGLKVIAEGVETAEQR